MKAFSCWLLCALLALAAPAYAQTVSGGGGSGGSGSNACASATGSSVPASGCYGAVNVGGTLRGQTGVNPSGSVYVPQTDTSSINGVTVLTGAGATGTGAQRVTASQDTSTVAGAAPLTTGVYVTGPSAAALATSANQTNANTSLSAIAASAATTATNSGLPIPAGTATIGGTVPTPLATGGPTLFSLIAANSTNATVMKASAGTLYHVSVYNNSATPAYLSFINTTTTPTCTTTPVYQVLIPANSTSGAGAVEDFALGAAFTTGISFCVTTGIGGTGSVAATTYSINATFK